MEEKEFSIMIGKEFLNSISDDERDYSHYDLVKMYNKFLIKKLWEKEYRGKDDIFKKKNKC